MRRISGRFAKRCVDVTEYATIDCARPSQVQCPSKNSSAEENEMERYQELVGYRARHEVLS